MAKKNFFFGRLAMVLALVFGLVLAGCDNGSGSGSGGDQQINAADLYGNWRATDPRAYDCYVTIASNGWDLSMSNGFSDYGSYTISGSAARLKSSVYNREIGTAVINDSSSIVVTTSAGPGYIASTVILYRQ